MKKLHLILLGIIAIALGLSIVRLLTRGREIDQVSRVTLPAQSPRDPEDKLVEYNVGRIIRSSNEPHEVTVIISIDRKEFVREEMVRLADQLKHDFADVRLLRVEILDDREIADSYVPAGDMYRLFNKAKRGTYVLNRTTLEERIQFSTVRGKPISEVKIDLSSLESINRISAQPRRHMVQGRPGPWPCDLRFYQALRLHNSRMQTSPQA